MSPDLFSEKEDRFHEAAFCRVGIFRSILRNTQTDVVHCLATTEQLAL